jgi:hypothetical protein
MFPSTGLMLSINKLYNEQKETIIALLGRHDKINGQQDDGSTV